MPPPSKTASFLFNAALVYVAAVGFYVRAPAKASAPSGRDVHVGASFTYEIAASRAVSNADGRTVARTSIGGKLSLVVVAASSDGFTVRAELSDPTRSEMPARDGREALDALSAPFAIAFGTDGEVLRVRFAERTPDEVRRELHAVVASLQIVAPDRAFDARWERLESDEAGRYVAVYDRTSGRLEKTKLRYELVRAPGGLVPPQALGKSIAIRSATDIALDASGWPATVHEEGTVVTTHDGLAPITMKATTEARLVSRGVGRFEAASAMLEHGG
ncbi:MAG: hypothetical protein KF819_09050 [Labilithrix sp.]|nr:hypothetical protein [Labilithrix sp.]